MRQPSVTVVIVNYNGADHLPACLDSLASLEYPSHLVRLLVVDNGSSDGSVQMLERRSSTVDLIRLQHNAGFAEGVRRGVDEASSECIALLNNDMRVAPDWLAELVRAYEPEAGVRCVAGVILDWTGERIDFAGGTANFHGFGDQPGYGKPLADVPLINGQDLLFACGGSMLVHRETFLEAGGFDPEFFAYFEDVDFGWRLNVLGHRVVLAARSRCFHRHHGTSRGLASYQKQLLLDRNALRCLIKNVSDEHLTQLLAPAVLLTVRRSLDLSLSSRAAYEPFARPIGSERVPAASIARLHAIDDVLRALPSLLTARERIQSRRRVLDDEVFRLFGEPLEPLGATNPDYGATFASVAHGFGLNSLFSVPETNHREASDLPVQTAQPGFFSRGLARSQHGDTLRKIARSLLRP